MKPVLIDFEDVANCALLTLGAGAAWLGIEPML